MALRNTAMKTGILVIVASLIGLFGGSVEAYNNDVRNAAVRLSESTDKLVSNLQSYLQANGRWVPKAGSDDMRACNAMQELQQQTNDLKNRAGNMTPGDLASASNRLNSNVRALEHRLRSIGADRRVINQLRNVSDDARNLGNFSNSNFGGGFGGGFGNNSGYAPNFNNGYSPNFGNNPTFNNNPTFGNNNGYQPNFNNGGAFGNNNGGYTLNSNDVRNATNSLDDNVNRLVTNLQTYLQSQGKWKPPAGSREMRACEILQDLQQQSRNLKSSGQGMDVSTLSSNSRRVSDTARDLKSELRSIGADGTVMNQMDLVSNSVRQLSSMTGDDYNRGGRGRGYNRGGFGRNRGQYDGGYDNGGYNRYDRRWR